MTRLAEKSWRHDRWGWGLVDGDTFTNSWSDEGPWHNEPDKVQWIDEATGYDCLAVRNHFGGWCGYVGLPPGHKLHGRPYQDIESDIDVHGGLTFSNGCNEEAPEGHGICHVPEPGRPDNVWWMGFDCAHFMDMQPRMIEFVKEDGSDRFSSVNKGTYRTLAYVQEECRKLAAQLKEHE